MGKGSLNRSTVVSKRKIDDITENTTSSNKHINKQIKAQKVQIKNHILILNTAKKKEKEKKKKRESVQID